MSFFKARKPRARPEVGATAAAQRWNELAHPRGSRGRFRGTGASDKPAADEMPPSPRKTVGEAALKSSGVGRDDEIQVLSSRVRAYANARTVGDFVDNHPQGRAYALRKLAADHAKGGIGFKSKAQTAQSAAQAPTEPKANAWSGKSTRRDISGDEFYVEPEAIQQGLFKNEAEFRQASEFMLAGMPKDEKLKITWVRGVKNSLAMVAANEKNTVRISRSFVKNESGWTARHLLFEIPKKYQGTGSAKSMLRSSVEQYDRMGVTRIETHANINVGGYAWARLGFSADNPTEIRQKVERAIRRAPRSPKAIAAKRALETSSDDDLMYNLANAQGADGERLGRQILGPRTSWDAHLDLKNARHRERLNRSFG